MTNIISSIMVIGKVGIVAGVLFGSLIATGFLYSLKRVENPPSTLGRNLALALIMFFSIFLIGPLFSFAYHFLFLRLSQAYAWLWFGGLHTLILAGVMNLYAWHRRMRDLKLILVMNAGGAFILGWMIPLLHMLLS